jgi:SNF2 family DNA or RNA helicase
MTGTPVENSVHDLISILDFTNPGLIGRSYRERLTKAAGQTKVGTKENYDPEMLRALSKALRPFVLRRTKQQVLTDLPEKTEKLLHCELSSTEARLYRELRDHYRVRLKGEMREKGLARSRFVVLEALLRLRQAACHPGLIDKRRVKNESAKVNALLEHLNSVVAEGHKALVFSQFTSLLDIVGCSLDTEQIRFERLDGKTSSSKRTEAVTRFQTDPAVSVFLISLKAGGVGLNLTAADYVFILDPWWNPAAESQAIDRAHRIGQKNSVVAYRLIAKDTVEEKILALQKTKRALADALISEDASLLSKLSEEDITLLLS